METGTEAALQKFQGASFCRYELVPIAGGATRVGALINVSFNHETHGNIEGVADLFPWPAFGDPPLEDWLGAIARRDFSSRVVRLALKAAHEEACARAEGRPLLGEPVQNHFLATNASAMAPGDWLEARRAGYAAVKIKIARDGDDSLSEDLEALKRAVPYLGSDMRLRLDANERATAEGMSRFLDQLPVIIRESIEFIEDPFPWGVGQRGVGQWAKFARVNAVSLAIDRPLVGMTANQAWPEALEMGFRERAFSVLIFKPAWMEEATALSARKLGLQVIVTSILGHPVGSFWAASRALALAPEAVHGCQANALYRNSGSNDESLRVWHKNNPTRGPWVMGLAPGLGRPGDAIVAFNGKTEKRPKRQPPIAWKVL